MPSLHRSLSTILPVLLLSCTPSKKDVGNVYRDSIITTLKTLDPALTQDQYSNMCVAQLYETLYQYKYLSRPYDVEPGLADSLPLLSDSGREYRIRLKPGVRFADDSCFPGGKGRTVTAKDFVYSVLRVADVRTQSTGWWIFEGKVRGLDEFRAATESLPPYPDSLYPALYDRPVEGIEAVDSLTVVLRLTKPYPYFKYILAMNYAAVVPHEAVTAYGEDFRHHPVGTGPFLLEEWRRGLRISFKRNPTFHGETYPTEGMPGDSAQGLLADAGKPLPFVDRVELHIFEEDQTMILNFLRGNTDRSAIPKDNYNRIVTPEKNLKGPYADAGFRLVKDEDLDLTYTVFNMEDPILGKHKKLRQALSMAEDSDDLIELFYNGRAIPANSPIPPGLFGYDSAYRNPHVVFDPEKAKSLLAEAGFPEGKGLPEIEYLFPSSATGRQMTEHFVQAAGRLGVKVKMVGVTWPEFLGRLKGKKFQIAGAAWGADYPDPENFLQLFYGPNESPGENNANFKNAEYDSLYRRMAVMQDSPERLAMIVRMKDILAEECPISPNTHRLREYLAYDWVGNLKPSAVINAPYKYLRVDVDKRRTAEQKAGL